MLNEIKEALEELQQQDPETFGRKVQYGKIKESEVPDRWNYITFNRKIIRHTGSSSKDYNTYYMINLIHEDFIPEDAVFKVISKLSKIKNLVEANEDILFDYTIRPGTDTVVEAAVITFTEPAKGYAKRAIT